MRSNEGLLINEFLSKTLVMGFMDFTFGLDCFLKTYPTISRFLNGTFTLEPLEIFIFEL